MPDRKSIMFDTHDRYIILNTIVLDSQAEPLFVANTKCFEILNTSYVTFQTYFLCV